MGQGRFDFALAIGGAAGQGIATPGDILGRIFVRDGLHLATYNAYQSIIRGGHILLTLRISDEAVYSHGDKLDLLLCLNQDTMDRHLSLMGAVTAVVYNSDIVRPGRAAAGVQFCPPPVAKLTKSARGGVNQNSVALARAGRLQHHSDWKTACEKAMMWGETIYIGLFFETDERDTPVDLDPVLSEGGPLARRPLGLTKEQARRMLQRMS